MADIVGIGNPLIDILVNVDHDTLKRLELEPGTMHLIGDDAVKMILSKLPAGKLAAGGSVANTVAGVAMLGGSARFVGSVGKDEHADAYENELIKGNVVSNLVRNEGITGKALTLITNDAQRTFIVNLGAALDLKKHHIDEQHIKDAKFLYVSGFELEDLNLRQSVLHAMDIAKANDVKIAIDLADPNLIKRAFDVLNDVVQNYADIVFANETEAKAFTEKEPEEALHELSTMCEIAVVKLGEQGSMIKKDGKVTKIDAYKVKAVDTTGAGDMYAAGFLYGLSKGFDLNLCGKIGSYASFLVVAKMGARLDQPVDIETLKNGN